MSEIMLSPRLNLALAKERGLLSVESSELGTVKQIVHLGIGAFHRAHQAVYTQQANEMCDDNWQVIGVSLRSVSVQEQLRPQNGLYSVCQTDVSGNSNSVMSVVKDVLVLPNEPIKVLTALAQAHTHIVSLTVTEKGYCHDPASGNLDLENTQIRHDLDNLSTPTTAIGLLVCSLKDRYEQGFAPYTVLCCDNLSNNGQTLKQIVIQFAEQLDKELALWIAENVPFPNTMVDRIVPATTKNDISELTRELDYQDLAMVKTERFSQWVIEDTFASDRPKWEKVGVSLVKDVEPFENAKLRLLNGAHSSLAYLGFLMGYDYVHQVMENKDLAAFLNHIMQTEIIPTIEPPQGINLIEYSLDLLQRFSNPALNHRTYQIAMDGSQKVPQRLLHTIEDKLEQNTPFDGLCFAVAGWLRYSMGFDLKGDPIEVQDPLADELFNIQKHDFYDIDKLIDGYLTFEKVFSKSLCESAVFRQKLTYWLGIILANGVETALKILLMECSNISAEKV
ncbi:MAG: mannitol dehydrogenase family protein [Paraglaciecola sp.]|uniref:mannitol dehydrogenase family protein n=1 Tax=Paraglaciecola sp. TaxID=1920173 RepID=UPI0032994F3E